MKPIEAVAAARKPRSSRLSTWPSSTSARRKNELGLIKLPWAVELFGRAYITKDKRQAIEKTIADPRSWRAAAVHVERGEEHDQRGEAAVAHGVADPGDRHRPVGLARKLLEQLGQPAGSRRRSEAPSISPSSKPRMSRLM